MANVEPLQASFGGNCQLLSLCADLSVVSAMDVWMQYICICQGLAWCAGPSIGTGLFARPHLLRLIAELASMLNAELAALSTVSRDASPVVELQAPMACLLSAAASLLEASQLLGQPNGSGISAAADREEADGGGNAPAAHEEAADLNAALPSYLSLACDLLQDHRPTKVRHCNSLHKPDTNRFVSISLL